jgi:release factor glutamine methyltransferase
MTGAFRDKGLDSPRMLAEQLVAHALACDRLRLYTDADRPASDDERARLRDLAARALRHEPVQYLVGEAWFYSLPLLVDRRVLIPRPSTATLVDAALPLLQGLDYPPRVADVCTGSGAIGVAILKNHPEAQVIATDVSADALEVARANAERHAVADRLDLRLGNLLEPLADEPPFDAVLANPPYIPDHEWPDVEPNVADHEPHLALRAGPDGLALIGPLLREAPSLLRPGGLLAIEIAACNRDAVLALAGDDDRLAEARVLDDLDRLARVLVARRA